MSHPDPADGVPRSLSGHALPPVQRRCLLVLNLASRSGAEARDPVLAGLRERGVGPWGGAPVAPQELGEILRGLAAGGTTGAAAAAADGPGGERPSLGPEAPDCILVGGGDGTLSTLLPHLLDAEMPVGILPLGTANDLAGSLGIPTDLGRAVEIALSGRTVPIDVGRVNGRPFLNVAHLGLGHGVMEKLSAELKARLGLLGYPSALLAAYRDARPFRVRIEPAPEDGPPRRLRCLHLSVGNGRRYGGGAVIHQDARLTDARLHLLALAPTPLWRLILLAPWLGSGRHRELDAARSLASRSFRIVTSRPLAISADGEPVGETPADFDVLPKALRVRVPPEGPEQAPALAPG